MIDCKQKVFKKGEPSVFVISSPLQLLCAREAICEFAIEDYEIIFLYYPGEIRNEQVVSMMSYWELNYNKYTAFGGTDNYRKIIFGADHRRYKRAFIGDYFNRCCHYIALEYLSKGGFIVYLDDGVANIPVLKNIKLKNVYNDNFSIKTKVTMKLLNAWCVFNNISAHKYFFTMYSDLDSKKICYPNTFKLLKEKLENSSVDAEDIYLIGTNPHRYCSCYGLTYEEYLKIYKDILKSLKEKYPNSIFYYIPHGRDETVEMKNICKEYGIEYKRLDEAIELYLVKNNIVPKAVVGTVSSALLTIKEIMPKVDVKNYYIARKSALWYKKNHETSLYYQQHGIEYLFIDVDTVLSK